MKVKTSKSVGQETPGLWVVTNNRKDQNLKSDRGRKKVHGNKVYLDDNQEFELELYNPTKESVLATINLNGKPISESGIVLRPGERMFLDCFVDDLRKFIFKTYEVDDNESAKNAISDNGSLEVTFYKEQITTSLLNLGLSSKEIHHHYHYYRSYPWFDWTYRPSVWYGDYSSGTFTINNSVGNTTLNTNILNGLDGTVTTGNTAFFSNTASFNNDAQLNASYSVGENNNSLLTGRVEKGNKSEMQFETVNMEFEKNYINKISYKLLPNKIKPVDKKDIINKQSCFCSNCGRKHSKSDNFCSGCGKALSK